MPCSALVHASKFHSDASWNLTPRTETPLSRAADLVLTKAQHPWEEQTLASALHTLVGIIPHSRLHEPQHILRLHCGGVSETSWHHLTQDMNSHHPPQELHAPAWTLGPDRVRLESVVKAFLQHLNGSITLLPFQVITKIT